VFLGVVMGGMVGKIYYSSHEQARPGSPVPKGGFGWDKKEYLEYSRRFSEPFRGGISERNGAGQD